jgi:hypothetical protein
MVMGIERDDGLKKGRDGDGNKIKINRYSTGYSKGWA